MGTDAQRRDWDLCNATWKGLVDRRGENPRATDFTPGEFVVVAVWTVFGIVRNGGFECLFSSDLPGDPGYKLALEAFRTLGCESALASFEGALSGFPGGVIPEDDAERKRLFMASSEEVRAALAAQFWNAEAEIVSKCAAYIRQTRVTPAQ